MMKRGWSVLLILSGSLSFAGTILPNGVGPLTKTAPDSAEARTILKNACDKVMSLQKTAKANCEAALQESKILSKNAVEFCLASGTKGLEQCLPEVVGRRFDESVLSLCRQVTPSDKTYYSHGRTECLRFFVGNQSSYDESGAKFCLKHGQGVFRQALGCLNTIRDREVPIKELEKECAGKGNAFYGTNPETFDQCLNRKLASAPLRKDVICTGSAQSGGAAAVPGTSGTR